MKQAFSILAERLVDALNGYSQTGKNPKKYVSIMVRSSSQKRSLPFAWNTTLNVVISNLENLHKIHILKGLLEKMYWMLICLVPFKKSTRLPKNGKLITMQIIHTNLWRGKAPGCLREGLDWKK
jgi:hypothetical protein